MTRALVLLMATCLAAGWSEELTEDLLVEQLTSLDPANQGTALKQLKDRPMILIMHLDAIEQAASSLDDAVLLTAFEVIADLRHDDAAPLLVQGLDHANENVQNAARDALKNLTGRDRVDDLAWEEWLEHHQSLNGEQQNQIIAASRSGDETKLLALCTELSVRRHHHSLLAKVAGTLIEHPTTAVRNLSLDLLNQQSGTGQAILLLTPEERQAWVGRFGLPILLEPMIPEAPAPLAVIDPEPRELSSASKDSIFLIIWGGVAAVFFWFLFRKGKEVVRKTLAIRRTRRITKRLVRESIEKGHTARIRRKTASES